MRCVLVSWSTRLLSSRVLTRVLSFFLWGDLRCGDGVLWFVTLELWLLDVLT